MKARLLVVLAALVVAAPASAARVGWNETAKIAGKRVMTYRVDDLSIGSSTWSAHVSFKNISNQTITVGNQFGVAFYTDAKATALSQVIGFATATKFSSSTPTKLKPGASWTGVISGSGRLLAGGTLYARVVFGPFTGMPGESHTVVWITDHARKIGTGPSPSPAPVGPVI